MESSGTATPALHGLIDRSTCTVQDGDGGGGGSAGDESEAAREIGADALRSSDRW